jgi:outer membrane protein assembly factor BamB
LVQAFLKKWSVESDFKVLILDENTGIQRYQTKIHEGVVPSNLTKYGKCIAVNDGLIYILDSKKRK